MQLKAREMITKIDFDNDLTKLLNPKIKYCPNKEKYHIDGKWANEISLEYIDSMTAIFEDNLLRHLNNFKNPREVLLEFCETIWNKIDWYKSNGIDHFEFLEKIESRIKEVELLDKPYTADWCSIDFVRGYNFENSYEEGNLFLILLEINAKYGGFENENLLEKAKLLNALQAHYEALEIFYSALYKIEMDFEYLQLENNSSTITNRKLDSSVIKCNIDLNKIETTILFRFIYDSNLFFMNSVVSKKRKELINFFEKNFNFTDKDGNTFPITRLDNELTKIVEDNRIEKQIETLKSLRATLDNHIKTLELKQVRQKKSPRNHHQ